MRKNKIVFILLSTILLLSMAITLKPTSGDAAIAPGTHLPTYAYLNVFPNPAGVGQSVTLGIFLASPWPTNEVGTNYTVKITNPSGTTTYNGPYTSDLTGGTVAYFTPDAVGNYTIQFIYPGQTLRNASGFNGLYADKSESLPTTLVVQQEAVVDRSLPFTPLPTQWWQLPVSAQNSQNWYQLTGAWLGLGANSFATTGNYNTSNYYNPYTEDVTSGHVLWTKPWLNGGVAGGIFGGDEVRSHYWSTFQYQPRYAPVIIDGVIYSTWYTFAMGSGADQGITAVDLYTGKTLWTTNTTAVLYCGMQMYQYTINDYGVRGPWLWATGTLPASQTGGSIPSNNSGTQYNLYDCVTGKYVMSVVNGTSMRLGQDDNGNLIGYFINNTAGTQMVHPRYNLNEPVTNTGPHMTAVNMTVCAGMTGSNGPNNVAVNTFRAFQTGYIYDMPVQTNISGIDLDPALSLSGITGNELVLTSGSTNHGQHGYMLMATMDITTGKQLGAANITYPQSNAMLPYTRVSTVFGDGIYAINNLVNYNVVAYNTKDCTKAWEVVMTGYHGAQPNIYDLYGVKTYHAKDSFLFAGLGGDIWSLDSRTGALNWYTNTTTLQGASGTETPYNVWPLWSFGSSCISNGIAYLAGGHEYNPPLFHGCQIYAVNVTDGSLVWMSLDTTVTSSAIAYSKLVTLNAYDNQLYCRGKGPSAMAVEAPSVGVTTSTPITITGTITDVSPGTQQQLVASNYPNGLPCISDETQSLFMEAVYQQQPMYNNMTGVPITISVIDSNNNLRDIGTTTSNAMGDFGFTWTPDIAGNYQVIATFKGSNSYYPSSAATFFFAGETPTQAPVVTPQTNAATTTDLMTYNIGVGIAIIIAIAIVGLLMLRRKP